MQLFDDVGIELETEFIHRSKSVAGFNSTHDASIESEFESFQGLPVIKNETPIRFDRNIFGTEYVTKGVLDTSSKESYLPILKNLTDSLAFYGENEKSYRAGFHVHVNFIGSLKLFQYLLRLSAHLEQILFLLGTMGYDYRGKQNDSCYCRPMTRYGPVCVPFKRSSFVQVFNLEDLYNSKSLNDFKEKYGDYKDLSGRVGRYLPVRYHIVNLKSCFEQGSAEFRVFNKSLNPYYLYAIIEFCKRVVKYSTYLYISKDKPELPEMSIFDIKDPSQKPHIINNLIEFLDMCGLREDPEIFEILIEIAEKGDINSIIFPEEYIYSHLMFHRDGNRVVPHWNDSEYSPARIPKEKIKKPNFVDIGVQRNSPNTPLFERMEEFRNSVRSTTNDIENYVISTAPSTVRGVNNSPPQIIEFFGQDDPEVEENDEPEEDYEPDFEENE